MVCRLSDGFRPKSSMKKGRVQTIVLLTTEKMRDSTNAEHHLELVVRPNVNFKVFLRRTSVNSEV